MLDQNTDRMWFVIGAVIVGAAIIFIANGTMPELFANVGGAFEGVVDNALYIDASYEAFGASVQSHPPKPTAPVAVQGISAVPAGLVGVPLHTELHGLGEARDRLYYDMSDQLWKVERHVGHYTFTGEETIQKNYFGSPYTSEENRRAQLYLVNRSVIPNLNGHGEVLFTHAPPGFAAPYDPTISNRSPIYGVVYFNVGLPETSDLPDMVEWLKEHRPVLTYILKTPVIEVLKEIDQQALNEVMK